jgi:two-component system, NarL family, response regulator DevR
MTTRIFLVDDHEIVRRGLRELFEGQDDLEVVGEASNAEEAMTRVPPTRPDVAVLDVRLPGTSGIEVCRDLRAVLPDLHCLMLTSFADDDALLSAVMAGASGYLLKQVRGFELVSAVRRVAAGQSLIHPAFAAGVRERLRGTHEDERIARLSPQERRVLDLIAEGMTNRQIGAEMFLAEKTVKNYVSDLLEKMGFSRRTEAAVYVASSEVDKRPHHNEGFRSFV